MARPLAVLALLASLTTVAPAAPSFAADAARPYITADDLDLRTFLPPPPANDSPQTRTELAEVLALQVTRTPDMEARAQADVAEDVWRFGAVMGPDFTADRLPRTAAFFARVAATEGAVVDPAKEAWKRPRPHQTSDLVRPAVKLSNSGAWPSGHATFATLTGIVLSNLAPTRRAAIMDRARAYGENRIVGGIHFRSDVETGRIAGSLIAQAVMARDDFKRDYAAAEAEMKAVLAP